MWQIDRSLFFTIFSSILSHVYFQKSSLILFLPLLNTHSFMSTGYTVHKIKSKLVNMTYKVLHNLVPHSSPSISFSYFIVHQYRAARFPRYTTVSCFMPLHMLYPPIKTLVSCDIDPYIFQTSFKHHFIKSFLVPSH